LTGIFVGNSDGVELRHDRPGRLHFLKRQFWMAVKPTPQRYHAIGYEDWNIAIMHEGTIWSASQQWL
jgi:hypothetical protein